MNWKRILKGKISIHYLNSQKWYQLPYIDRFWSGRLIYINLSKFYMVIDCRIDFVKDMINRKPE
jgi:hypothetical protein